MPGRSHADGATSPDSAECRQKSSSGSQPRGPPTMSERPAEESQSVHKNVHNVSSLAKVNGLLRAICKKKKKTHTHAHTSSTLERSPQAYPIMDGPASGGQRVAGRTHWGAVRDGQTAGSDGGGCRHRGRTLPRLIQGLKQSPVRGNPVGGGERAGSPSPPPLLPRPGPR